MMDQTVTLLATAVCLFGTALGLRFRVYVLLPAGLAILISPEIAHLIWRKMTGWGVMGALGLLVVLNVGYVLGLLLRAGVARWNARKVAGLFARTARVAEPSTHPSESAQEAKSEVVGPAPSIVGRTLAKGSYLR